MRCSRRQLIRLFSWFPALSILSCKNEAAASRQIVLGKASTFPEGLTDLPLLLVTVRRSGSKFSATTLRCSHQHCLLQRSSGELRCPCHGSIFSTEGEVKQGPATAPLAHYRLSRTTNDELIAHLDETVSKDWMLDASGPERA